MNTKKLHLEDDRRCSAEKLERILEKLPIEVDSTTPLNARMGLGRIIYMRPENGGEVIGEVRSVKIGGVLIKRYDLNHLYFEYGEQKYEIRFD